SLEIGAPENPAVTIGPLIDEAAFNRVRNYIEIGRCEAKLAFAGSITGTQPHADYFVAPTIFTEVPPNARIATEEIFGPVLAVMRAADFGEALALANDTEFGLTAGLYSR